MTFLMELLDFLIQGHPPCTPIQTPLFCLRKHSDRSVLFRLCIRIGCCWRWLRVCAGVVTPWFWLQASRIGCAIGFISKLFCARSELGEMAFQ